MQPFGVEDIFNLAAYGLRKKKSTVEGTIPTTEDLARGIVEMRALEGSQTAPETQNAGKETEKEKQGLSDGSQSVSEGTACIPCSQDHLSTCSGLLAEALRFARNDGIESPEAISRVGLCADELNALERVDLRPELTSLLPHWEREIANGVLTGSRNLRHDMAGILSVGDLENVAGRAQALRRDIGAQWLKGRITNMSPDEKAKVREKAQEMLEKELE
jgi:hypothetical protein